MELGEHGEVSCVLMRKDEDGRWKRATGARRRDDRYRARAYFRAWDGTRGEVSRMAARSDEARAAVLAGLADALRRRTSDLTGDTRLGEAARAWVAELSSPSSRLSPNSVQLYSWVVERIVCGGVDSVEALRLREFNHAPRVREYLQVVADRHGAATAKSTKSVLSGVIDFAILHGAVDTNQVRAVPPARATGARVSERDHRRALNLDEALHLQEVADARAASSDVGRSRRKWLDSADLVAFMLGTGARISEGLGVEWDDLDLETGRCLLRGTKTSSSHRSVTLPESSLLLRMRSRAARVSTRGYIFASPMSVDRDGRWELRSAERALRALLDEAGLDWAVTHTLRRTVATRLDEAGAPVRRIADQLGHRNVRTTIDAYLGRDLLGDKADLAALLDKAASER